MSISLSNLSKFIGNHLIVNNVSLKVNQGELFVLLGASGSGKSTILKLIAGLLHPEGGTIHLHGKDVTFLPPQDRGVGFVFQNYSIFKHLTVAENVEFGLRVRNVPAAKRRPVREELLDLVGLVGFADRLPHQLSGGQQQRVALARALAYQPQVLLLDEPFGALDVKIRAQLRENLKNIQRKLKITTILVTHDQEEAFELADRIGVVENGQLLEVGTSDMLYQQPGNEFVATFIGGGNVLVGRKEMDHILLGQIKLPFPPGAPEHDEDTPVRILFRPETVSVRPDAFTAQDNVYNLGRGKIVRQVFSGASVRLRLEIEGLRGVRPITPSLQYGQRAVQIEALLNRKSLNEPDYLPGQSVWVGMTGFHVLGPSGLKLLICVDDTEADKNEIAFGLNLARMAGGQATLFAVAPEAEGIPKLQTKLATIPRGIADTLGIPVLTRIRQGSLQEETLGEAQEGSYELVALAIEDKIAPIAHRTHVIATARQILIDAGIPVLLVRREQKPQIHKVLICTAGGEPGKTDVRFGGRLARRTGASVTLFHIHSSHWSPDIEKRVRKHLSDGLHMLTATGVQGTTKIVQGEIIQAIREEAKAGGYDMVVIGASGPPGNKDQVWSELTTQVVNGIRQSVLIVPMKG